MRQTITILALIGCAISTYLTLFQWHVIGGVWDPLFGAASSEAVLASSLSRALPVPDATLGAIAYLIEAILSFVSELSNDPRVELLLHLLIIVMALTGLGLLAVQLLFVHALCSLCLCSALISWIIFGLARPLEVLFKTHAGQHAT